MAIAIAACGPTAVGPGGNGADAGAIIVKQPPVKGGEGTAPACDGVTARGECRTDTAVTCDLASGTLRMVACGALGQKCVIDPDRGASCRAPSDVLSCNDVDESGFCDTDDVAYWCDPSAGLEWWDCAAEGKTCQVDKCFMGAGCCPAATTPMTCGDLTLQGRCDGQTARFCLNGSPVALDCGALGKSCRVNQCAEGAYCCEDADPTCDTLGTAGECDGNVARFCTLDGALREIPCDQYGKTCGFNTCSRDAAACCSPTCGNVGAEGLCVGDVLNFCESNQVKMTDCAQMGLRCVPPGSCTGFAGACCQAPTTTTPLCSTLLITEVQVAGVTASDEFVEIAGPKGTALAGMIIQYRAAAGTTDVKLFAFPTGATIPDGGRVVVGHMNWTGAGSHATDSSYYQYNVNGASGLLAANGGIALVSGGNPVDSVGWGTATNAYVKGRAAASPPAGMSIARNHGCDQSSDNLRDFTAGQPGPWR